MWQIMLSGKNITHAVPIVGAGDFEMMLTQNKTAKYEA